jgi:signal peptidase I
MTTTRGGWAGTAALAAGVVLGALMLLPAALGYGRYVVIGGSMSGTYPRGSLVFDEEVPTASLRAGDVITYRPPPGAGPRGLVTHRIVWTGRAPGGARAFRTKGDANVASDPWRFELHGRTQAKVVFSVPLLGWPFAALAERSLRMLLIGVPALLVACAALARLWRESGERLGVPA